MNIPRTKSDIQNPTEANAGLVSKAFGESSLPAHPAGDAAARADRSGLWYAVPLKLRERWLSESRHPALHVTIVVKRQRWLSFTMPIVASRGHG